MGYTLLIGIIGSLVLSCVASYLRYWPFGFVRTNLFEIPLLVLLAGIGVAGTTKQIRSNWRYFGIRHRVVRTGTTSVLVGVVIAIAGMACLGALIYEGASYQELIKAQPPARWGAQVRDAVAIVRRNASPDVAAVVIGNMAVNGWRYYLYQYDGRAVDTGPRIQPANMLFTVEHGGGLLTSFVSHRHPSRLFYYVPDGTTSKEINDDLMAFAKGGLLSRNWHPQLPNQWIDDHASGQWHVFDLRRTTWRDHGRPRRAPMASSLDVWRK